jgi:hypothetical protein
MFERVFDGSLFSLERKAVLCWRGQLLTSGGQLLTARVTRLGEFSPIEQVFAFKKNSVKLQKQTKLLG